MIGARARLLVEKAKKVPKYTQNSTPSQPQPSTSRPAVVSSPPSPPCAPRKSSAIPQLVLSTLHKRNDDSFNSSTEKERESQDCSYNSNYGSGVSGVSKLSNTEDLDVDVHDILNTAYTEEASFEKDVTTTSEQSQNLGTTSRNTRTPPIELTPPAQNVATDFEQSQTLRRTLSGGIRTTPRRAVNFQNKSNLVRGGHKKVDSIENIGEFKNKYKATEKTKHLISKHGREAAENLLKLNNSEVDGLNEKENGFILIYKTGNKLFIVSEGNMGKNMVENEEYRKEVFESAQNVEINLKTPMLTSLLKSQYGNKKGISTPETHKRSNYRGIGSAPKRKKVADDASETRKSKKKQEQREKNIEESDDASDKSVDLEEEEDETSLLQTLIRKEIEPNISRSKPPKKQARQLYPFQCSECAAKYKTLPNFEKHLRSKHGL